MKSLFLAAGLILAAPSLARADAATDKVKKLTAAQLNSDLRTTVKKGKGLCGATGTAYVATVEYRKLVKAFDRNQKIIFKSVWEPIKEYGILASDLGKAKAALMDGSACSE